MTTHTSIHLPDRLEEPPVKLLDNGTVVMRLTSDVDVFFSNADTVDNVRRALFEAANLLWWATAPESAVHPQTGE
jgi:hypothetical protein